MRIRTSLNRPSSMWLKIFVHLVCLQYLQQYPRGNCWAWIPRQSQWSTVAIVDTICGLIGRALNEFDEHRNGYSVTYWHSDPAREVAWAAATSGFDFEYLFDQRLPLDKSYTGRVAKHKRGWTCRVSPLDSSTGFYRVDKAIDTGLRQMLSGPVYVGPVTGPVADGVLHLYEFSSASEYRLPTRRAIKSIIRDLERSLTAAETLRNEAAAGFLDWKMRLGAGGGFRCRSSRLPGRSATLAGASAWHSEEHAGRTI